MFIAFSIARVRARARARNYVFRACAFSTRPKFDDSAWNCNFVGRDVGAFRSSNVDGLGLTNRHSMLSARTTPVCIHGTSPLLLLAHLSTTTLNINALSLLSLASSSSVPAPPPRATTWRTSRRDFVSTSSRRYLTPRGSIQEASNLQLRWVA